VKGGKPAPSRASLTATTALQMTSLNFIRFAGSPSHRTQIEQQPTVLLLSALLCIFNTSMKNASEKCKGTEVRRCFRSIHRPRFAGPGPWPPASWRSPANRNTISGNEYFQIMFVFCVLSCPPFHRMSGISVQPGARSDLSTKLLPLSIMFYLPIRRMGVLCSTHPAPKPPISHMAARR
jgi:hypothetical protein